MEVEEGDFAIEEVSKAEITTYVFITCFHESYFFQFFGKILMINNQQLSQWLNFFFNTKKKFWG